MSMPISPHYLDRQRVEAFGFDPGAHRFKTITENMTQVALGHLAAG